MTSAELDLAAVDAVGFDMDETLAVYRRSNFLGPALASALEKLVAAGYPPDITGLSYDLEFGMRGLLIDRRRGHVLKLAGDGTIERAFHGLRRLSADEIRAAYARERDLEAGRLFFEVETFFSTPIPVLFAALVEYGARADERIRYHVVLRDVIEAVRDSIVEAAARRVAQGSIEELLDRDAALGSTLERLRASGKRLFVLTNSTWPYTDALMSWLFAAPDRPGRWTDLFDAVVVDARKPSFFTTSAPFGTPATGPEARPPVRSGGNAKALEALLEAAGDRILYLGDHLHEDVIVPRQAAGWRTALVAAELEASNRYWGDLLRTETSPSGFHRRVERHAAAVAARVTHLLRRPS